MLPASVYESLPKVYLIGGLVLLLQARSPLVLLAGALLYLAAALIWIMRSTQRRTDITIYPNKMLFLPDSLYEFKPFVYGVLALLLWRLPQQQWWQLLALTLGAWGLMSLYLRARHRRCRLPFA
ncbi:hypothetical protein ABHF91_05360 [Pseudaeromonas sp. ZJS20]|uniref:hypothetical protein n=1 Tax=Pseudaeromonas aegiceratis TaxID=3153928 RepID=UPI00390C7284